MVENLSPTPVVYRSPFRLTDGSPASIPIPSLTFNPRDEVFRRFSDPASDDERQLVSSHVMSAESAYNKAVKSVQVYFRKSEVAELLSPVNSTKKEVHRVALDISKAQGDIIDKSKMGKVVNVLDHYQGVFDILSQADFSYLALLWGCLKFILIMSKNHCDLLTKMTDMLIDIGLNLRRVEVFAALFPTTRMLEMTADLYAAIVEFLEQIIAHFRKKLIKRYMSSFWQSFDLKFDRLVTRIDRIHKHIERDAHVGSLLMQMAQSKSLSILPKELALQRFYLEESLKGVSEETSTTLFQNIKRALFHGFELQAGFHEELALTYKVTTSAAWDEWFRIEQRYVPSAYSHETRVIQAECDAPDPQHALLWVAQQRKLAPQIPSTYLIWTTGMTAQSAVGSLVYQIMAQKPHVLSSAGIDTQAVARANSSIKVLWNLFLQLADKLGGCMVYISFGSVGPEEFTIVHKFINLVKTWQGPAINVTLIHPYHEKFERTEDVVDLDEKYDVHPSLTITDAMHHVLLLELNIHDHVSETVHRLLWETVWREIRYSVIGIALASVIQRLQAVAGELSTAHCQMAPEAKDLWTLAIARWTENKFAMNLLREQIQRHLNMVPLHCPAEVKSKTVSVLRRTVLSHDMDSHDATNLLSTSQRYQIWEFVTSIIRPRTDAMFCSAVPQFLEEILDTFEECRPSTEKQARSTVAEMARQKFGQEGMWRESFAKGGDIIVQGIALAMESGIQMVAEALMQPDNLAAEEV